MWLIKQETKIGQDVTLFVTLFALAVAHRTGYIVGACYFRNRNFLRAVHLGNNSVLHAGFSLKGSQVWTVQVAGFRKPSSTQGISAEDNHLLFVR